MEDRLQARRFVWALAVGVGLLAIVPFIYGSLSTPSGSRYLGFQFGTDDQMVYAAWMRQAMNGHFLMDNRFAIDPQPGLTIHLYFWALGMLAKLTGIPLAAAAARALFGGLFVVLLAKLVRLVTPNAATFRVAMLLSTFGAGIGFLAWQPLGNDFSGDSPLKNVLLGHLPNDVWQPEGFVFSSLLTNSLFSVSLCLILGIFYCVLRSRDSWKPVPLGALGMLVLMNVHSYDVLLVALVLVGLLVTAIVKKQLTAGWLLRVIAIGVGALPSALWFVYVLRHDAVFQSRAGTLTFTENFRSIFAGYCLFMLLAAIGAVVWLKTNKAERKAQIGVGALTVMLLGMFVASADHVGQVYWMGGAAWGAMFIVALGILALVARANPSQNLVLSWAVVGLVAPYFPGLFQRKLMMGLSIPWAILAAVGIVLAVKALKANERKLVLGLATLLLSATSIQWISREFAEIRANDSNTTMQPVYLSPDAAKIVDYLNANADDKRNVVLSMPGIWGGDGEHLSAPIWPDLNPILSGLTGVYTYAGHWSETPDYLAPDNKSGRRITAQNFFLFMPKSDREQLAGSIGAKYVLTPVPERLPIKTKRGTIYPLDVRDMGTVVVDGEQMRLIKL